MNSLPIISKVNLVCLLTNKILSNPQIALPLNWYTIPYEILYSKSIHITSLYFYESDGPQHHFYWIITSIDIQVYEFILFRFDSIPIQLNYKRNCILILMIFVLAYPLLKTVEQFDSGIEEPNVICKTENPNHIDEEHFKWNKRFNNKKGIFLFLFIL